MNTVVQSPPENRDDVMENIFTFLDFNRPELYQLLANMVNTTTNDNYQVYGQFEGKHIITPKGKRRFLIENINLKWVDIISNHSTPCRVAKAQFEKKKDGLELQVFLKNVYEPHHGVDCRQSVNQRIKNGKKIYIKVIQEGEKDYSVNNANGFPCNHFGLC